MNIPEGCSPLTKYYKPARYGDPAGEQTFYREINGWDGSIDTITIHCTVGHQKTAEGFCNYFATIDRVASCNYCIGDDGSVGVCVPEPYRSACTSNNENDKRAVTIEVSSDIAEPYSVTEEAYYGLIDLVTDICKRNQIKRLVWSEEKLDRIYRKNGCNMTVHCDYSDKTCPGTYLYERHGAIAAEVNSRLAPVISDFKITNISSTNITASFLTTNDELFINSYSYGYNIYKIAENLKTEPNEVLYCTNFLQASTNFNTFETVKNLIPNTTYAIELFVVDNTAKSATKTNILTPRVHFKTIQDYPEAVSAVNIHINSAKPILTEDTNIALSFNTPTSWGFWAKNKKGYIISTIINGNTIASYDNLIYYNNNKYIEATIPIKKLLNSIPTLDIFNKSLQIGIQTWVTDNDNNIILNQSSLVSSNSIYLLHNRSIIDKIYVKSNESYDRTIPYLRKL